MIFYASPLSFLAATVLWFCGHASSECAAQATLKGTTWKATSISGRAVLDDTEVTAIFNEDGTFEATAGCNSYESGSFFADGASIKIGGEFTATLVECENEIMEQEAAYMSALRVATVYEIDCEKFELRDDGGATLVAYIADGEEHTLSGNDHTLVGTKWQATKIKNSTVIQGTIVTAYFDVDGKFSGNSGCNVFEGKYEVSDNSTFRVKGKIASTKKLCPNVIMEQEREFLAALANATIYKINGDSLFLDDDGSDPPLLTFVAETVTESSPKTENDNAYALIGTTWNATKIHNLSVAQGTIITALFDESGKVSGSTGCNRYEGNYRVTSNSTLLIDGTFAVTDRFCGDNVMKQEISFLDALANATIYKINGDILFLGDDKGFVPLVTFAAEATEGMAIQESSLDSGCGNEEILVGTKWKATKMKGEQLLPRIVLTARFEDDGSVAGTSGCNSYSGTYSTLGDSKISFDDKFITTIRMCLEDAMAKERDFMSALANVTGYRIQCRELELYDESGTGLVTFILEDEDEGLLPVIADRDAPIAEARCPQKATLTDTTWKATNVNGKILEGTDVMAKFDEDGTVKGSSGCNSYSGGYMVTSNSAITFGEVFAVTTMICLDNVMADESAYMSALANSTSYEILCDELILRDDNNATLLIYVVADGDEITTSSMLDSDCNGEVALTGTKWKAINLNGESLQDTTMTAGFDEDGTVKGSSGCNSYTGDYTVTGNSSITFGETFAVTTMMCLDDVMDHEGAYMSALANSTSFEIDCDELRLKDDNNVTLVTFVIDDGEDAIAVSLMATECNNDTTVNGTLWKATSIKGENILLGTELIAQFKNSGTISGFSGCNSFTSGYEITSNTTINFEKQFTSTQKMCVGDIIDQETEFLGLLMNSSAYQIDCNKLVFRDSSGNPTVAFVSKVGGVTDVAICDNEEDTLAGTIWVATSVIGQDVLNETEISAYFNEDGKLSGSTGCNRYKTDYQATDVSEIFIDKNIGGTKRLCNEPDGVMKQETTYLEALRNASAYIVDCDKLELFHENGTVLVTYVARAAVFEEDDTVIDNECMYPSAFIGTTWKVKITRKGLAPSPLSPLLPNTEITAIFKDEGRLDGTSGCNRYSGHFENVGFDVDSSSSATALEIDQSDIAMTGRLCRGEEGVLEQELGYLRAFVSVESYKISCNELQLLDGNKEILVIFVDALHDKDNGVITDNVAIKSGDGFRLRRGRL